MVDPLSFNPNQPVENPKKKSPMILFIAIIIVVLVGGFLIFKLSKKTVQPKTTAVTQNQPSPTEKPKIEKSSVKIQVKNGTGTPGQAGIAVDELKSAGYNVDNIKTANADVFDNTVTTITVKDGFDDIANDIKNALITKFTDVTIDSSHLDQGSEFDVVIVTGGKKFEEPTPTAAPNPSDTPTPTNTPTPTPIPTPTVTPTSSP